MDTADERQQRLLSLALYLPQFHAIPENDLWWGRGFTEWTKLRQAIAKPGHVPIRQPVDPLGWYNLLDPVTLEAQAQIATDHGIDGFAVWDYWFGRGQRLLEKPIELVLAKRLRFPYCLAWANHSWVDRRSQTVLRKQQYLGREDYTAHFASVRRHFESDNYIAIDGKPVFFIYSPRSIPDLDVFVDTWRELAVKSGFRGLCLIGDLPSHTVGSPAPLDRYSASTAHWTLWKKLPLNYLKEKLRTQLRIETTPQRYDYWTMVKDSFPDAPRAPYVPTILTGWDTTVRHGRNGVRFEGFSVDSFRRHLADAERCLRSQSTDTAIVMIKSWNEWAEQNLLEPDSVFGFDLLREVKGFRQRVEAPPAPAAGGGSREPARLLHGSTRGTVADRAR